MNKYRRLLKRLGWYYPGKLPQWLKRWLIKLWKKLYGDKDPDEPLVISEQIADEDIELTKPDPDGTRYYATIDPDEPTLFTEEEVEDYAESLIGEDYELPETLQNGEPLPDELELEELMVDNENDVRRIVLSKKVNWQILKSIKVTRQGITIKKHDGTV